jgi:hypothetical protein
VYDNKKYCIEDWVKRTIKIMNDYHEGSELVIVDNSNTPLFASWLRLFCDQFPEKNRIKVLHLHDMANKTSRERQRQSQLALWRYTLENDYEYLFILESDVFPNKKNIVTKLLEQKKLICSGVFPLQNGETKDKDILCVMGYQMMPGRQMFWMPRGMFDKIVSKFGDKSKAIKIYACGFGCILIHKNVLKKIKPEYSKRGGLNMLERVKAQLLKESSRYGVRNYILGEVNRLLKLESDCVKKKIHPDTNFHLHCEMYGFPRFVVPDQTCRHMNSGWDNIPIKR